MSRENLAAQGPDVDPTDLPVGALVSGHVLAPNGTDPARRVTMSKTAAGLLLFRRTPTGPQVLLVHLGGPFWARKDLGSWSIPKGEPAPGEDLLAAARREFLEETGFSPPGTPFALGQIKQRGGKVVHAWALEGEFDPRSLTSNTFEVEWPAGSGQVRNYPEVDRAEWFDLAEARRRLLGAQVPFLDVFAASPHVRSAL